MGVQCAVRGCQITSTHELLIADEPFFDYDDSPLMVCAEHADLAKLGGVDARALNFCPECGEVLPGHTFDCKAAS